MKGRNGAYLVACNLHHRLRGCQPDVSRPQCPLQTPGDRVLVSSKHDEGPFACGRFRISGFLRPGPRRNRAHELRWLLPFLFPVETQGAGGGCPAFRGICGQAGPSCYLEVEQVSAKNWRSVEYMVSQDSVNHVADGDGQSQEGHVPRAHPPSPTARVAASFHSGGQGCDHVKRTCTTSACRGKIRSVRKSCTSGSESEQQSSTTYRL